MKKLSCLFFIVARLCVAQQPDNASLSLFVDCEACDMEHIQSQVDDVRYVRDPHDADVHLLIRTRGGIGILEYTLAFVGRKNFTGVSDTLTYVHSRSATVHERRDGLARTIRLGLVRYYARIPFSRRVKIVIEPNHEGPLTRARPNTWSYRIAMDGSYRAEQSIRLLRSNLFLSAGRVTDEQKIEVAANGGVTDHRFDFDDETIASVTRNGDLRGLAVWSIADRWAAGAFVSTGTSSFTNTTWTVSASAAIEYTFFPYSEASHREARINYFLGFRHLDYEERTIFSKRDDSLIRHAIELTVDTKQTWGSSQVSVEAGHYLIDMQSFDQILDLYRLEVFVFTEVRLVRGLSFYAQGTFSRIRDQIFLSARAASQEDVLLGAVKLPTSFDYSFTAGLSVTLGSVYSAVVNPRFGD
ncbi:MAG: hypothetical protein KJO98_09080 [Rhodothermia bacterium]|nr:hypothetical protein [Rhodothermia bacterium]